MKMKSLLTPGVCLVAVAVLLHTGLITPSPLLIAYAFYGVLIAGLLLAWRFHSSRIFFALLILFLAQQAVGYFSQGRTTANGPGSVALAAVGLLLPLNFALLSFELEKGFTFSSVAPASLLLFVESVIVAVLCRPAPAGIAHAARHAFATPPLPFASLLAFSAAGIVLLTRYMLFRKPAESGLFWALSACMLSLRFGGVGRIPEAYFAASAFILAGAIVETSYLLAYHDELTTLPSRRAFHDALLRLESPYSIAMVDIDHFKRCNDTYGHDTGDQVLRMIASRLGRVTGGGQAYRCGGEEFAILFSGKTTGDVLEHLEKLRIDIEGSKLRLRGPDRRQEERGPDRRNQRARGRGQTGHAIRELSRVAPSPLSSELSVTASIGVATSRRENPSAEEVVQAADKALYRAKAAGRNRVETAAPKRRVRTKAAGIA
jgi:GGDEF domain-containing protein